jgi:Tfp pilus assembly protein PilX
MDTTMFDTKRRGETGSALFIAVMMLVLMGFLGLAALERVGSDEQVAGFQNRQRTAFYAAEAGVSDGRLEVKDSAAMLATTRNWHTAAAPQDLGDAALYDREGALPRFYGDPDATNPFDPSDAFQSIEKVGKSAKPVPGGRINVGSRSPVQAFWQVSALGQSPDRSVSRQQAVIIRQDPPATY